MNSSHTHTLVQKILAYSSLSRHKINLPSGILSMLPLIMLMVVMAWSAPQVQAQTKVLILDSTVSGGASSREAQAAIALGYTVEVVNAAGWAAKTQADFSTYRALILGDQGCGGSITAAEANKAVWGPVVNGNVIIIGTDPVFHVSQGGGTLTDGGIKFAVDKVGKTGMYITLSCYYHGAAAMTAVPLLDAFSPGGFSVTGVGCFDNAHIVATHPSLTGITDTTLSNWSCSVHEAFDKWPLDFQVLAIAHNIGSAYTAPDGSIGTPYILARGVTVISDIKLTPETAENPVGTSHTVTATVTQDTPAPGTPVIGKLVTFTVISGPNTGATGTGTTGAAGTATFTYISNGTVGVDLIKATFVDDAGRTQTSNLANKTWVVRATPESDPRNVSVSDQKAGAFLAFPYYTAKSGSDTRLTISNTGDKTVAVHMYFLDSSCNQADQIVCLTPNASQSFLASEYDPENTGYLLAVAVSDSLSNWGVEPGCPVPYNGLIGNAFVNDGSYNDTYGAEAFWAHGSAADIATCNTTDWTATLKFNGSCGVGGYDYQPTQHIAEIQSPNDSTGQKIIVAGLRGTVGGTINGAGQEGIGVAFNDGEKPGSYSSPFGSGCQRSFTIDPRTPRVPGGLGSQAGINNNALIPSGRTGTLKWNTSGSVGLIMTPKLGNNKWSGIRTLHKTLSTRENTLTIPILSVPSC